MCAVGDDAVLVQPVTVKVERNIRESETIELTLTDPLWHRLIGPSIDGLLDLLPADQTSVGFRQASIKLIVIVLLVATLVRCVLRFAQE